MGDNVARVTEERAHSITLRLLEGVATKLPEDREQEVLAQVGLIEQLLNARDEASARETAAALLRDAL